MLLLRCYGLFLAGFGKIITLEEEFQKQKQVTAVHDERSHIVVGGQPAILNRFCNPQQVAACYRNGDSDNHLRDLRNRNVHRLEGLGLAIDRHQEVVKVHNRMHSVIHDTKDQADRCLGDVGSPAIQQHGDVMVPVQEYEFFLVDHNEERVKEFGKLGKNKELHPKSRRTRSIESLGVKAKVLSQTVVDQIAQKMGRRANKANCRKNREPQVPKCHQTSQVPWLASAKVPLTENDKGAIG